MTPDPDKLAQNPWDGLRLPDGSLRARRFAAALGAVRIGQAGHTATTLLAARIQGRSGLARRSVSLLERLLGRRAGKGRDPLQRQFLRFLRFRRPVPLQSPSFGGRMSAARPSAGAAPVGVLRFLPGSVTRETISSVVLRASHRKTKGPVAAWPGIAPPLPSRFFMPSLFTPSPVARHVSVRQTAPAFAPEVVRRSERDATTRNGGSSQEAQEPLWRERAPRMEMQPLSRPPVPQASWLGVSPPAPPLAERLPLAQNRAAKSFSPPMSLSAAPLPRPPLVALTERVYGTRAFAARPLSDLTPTRNAPGPPTPQKPDAPSRPHFRFATRLLATAAAFSFVQALPSLQPIPARAASISTAPLRLGAGVFVRPALLTESARAVAGQTASRAEARAGARPDPRRTGTFGSQRVTGAADEPRPQQAPPRQVALRQSSNLLHNSLASFPRIEIRAFSRAVVRLRGHMQNPRSGLFAQADRRTFTDPDFNPAAPYAKGLLSATATRLSANAAFGPVQALPFLRHSQTNAASVPAAAFTPLLQSNAPTLVQPLDLRTTDQALAGRTRTPAAQPGAGGFVPRGFPYIGPSSGPQSFPPADARPTPRVYAARLPLRPLVAVSEPPLRQAPWDAAPAVPGQEQARGSSEAGTGNVARLFFPRVAERPGPLFYVPDMAATRPEARRVPLRNHIPFTVTDQVLDRWAGRPSDPRRNSPPVGRSSALPPGAAPTQTHDGLPERLNRLTRITLRRAARTELPTELPGDMGPKPSASSETKGFTEGFEEAVTAEFQTPLLALVRGFLRDFLGRTAASAQSVVVPSENGQKPTIEKPTVENPTVWTARRFAALLSAVQRAALPPFDAPSLGPALDGENAGAPGTPAWAALSSPVFTKSQALRDAQAPWSRRIGMPGMPRRGFLSKRVPSHSAGGLTLADTSATRRGGALTDALKVPAASHAPAMVLPFPTAPLPSDEGWAIQRVASGSASAGRAEAKSPQQDINLVAEEKGAAANDVHLLANEVWSLLKRRLETEAERTGRH